MSNERRYSDDEVARIFETATTVQEESRGPLADPRASGSGTGLTLAELKEIGTEVGLPPERIEAAATALDSGGLERTTVQRRLLGLPVSVGRVVPLPRAPTDEEWEILVGELRRTFAARGKVGGHGALRDWTNSKLHALVERTKGGYQLRLGTTKGNAVPFGLMGGAGVVMAIPLALREFMKGQPMDALFVLVVFGIMGMVALSQGVITLPSWARRRREQMDYIAERALELVGGEGVESPSTDPLLPGTGSAEGTP